MSKLCIPQKILSQHVAVLGKTGAGKSSALRHVVEHLLDHKKRVCVIDPKGDWWGLKKSGDGKSVGYDVIAFGDFKESKATDIPINAQSGKHVAELITSGNRPCIIGFRGWTTGAMVRFWIDFASTLFNANSGELYLVGDEFHNFAPKGKIMDPEAGKCLHWSNRLLSEGRGLGIIVLMASQRPQKVHNDSLTSAETLVAMRVVHAADRKAVQDWIEGCGDMEKGREVLNSLAARPRGEAFVWSPEIGFGPELVRFPMFETFDSFAPPQLQKKVSDSGWSAVDLDDVRKKMAAVIEEAKANDPGQLKAEVQRLKRELVSAQKGISQKATEKTEIRIKEVPILKAVQITALAKVVERCTSHANYLQEAGKIFRTGAEEVSKAINDARWSGARPSVPPTFEQTLSPHANSVIKRAIARTVQTRASEPAEVSISGGVRRMMVALAQRPGISAEQLGVRSGLSSRSGSFGTYLGKLRSAGFVAGERGSLQLTDRGVSALGHYEALPVGHDLLEYWARELGGGLERMLRALAEVYPGTISAEELGERVAMSSGSGSFGTYLGKLRSLELVTGPRGALRASEEFFE